jgi:N-acyl-L-homoserine lactone synthetase
MIYAVSAENQHKFASQLDEMFASRQARSGFVSATDELDDENAVYLIHMNDEGHVLESVRLNPVGDARWQTSLWPAEPSEALAEAVTAFCRMNGLAPVEG